MSSANYRTAHAVQFILDDVQRHAAQGGTQVRHGIVQHKTTTWFQCNTAQFVRHGSVDGSTAQHTTTQCKTSQPSTVAYSTVYRTALQCTTGRCRTTLGSTVQYSSTSQHHVADPIHYVAVHYSLIVRHITGQCEPRAAHQRPVQYRNMCVQ